MLLTKDIIDEKDKILRKKSKLYFFSRILFMKGEKYGLL